MPRSRDQDAGGGGYGIRIGRAAIEAGIGRRDRAAVTRLEGMAPPGKRTWRASRSIRSSRELVRRSPDSELVRLELRGAVDPGETPGVSRRITPPGSSEPRQPAVPRAWPPARCAWIPKEGRERRSGRVELQRGA